MFALHIAPKTLPKRKIMSIRVDVRHLRLEMHNFLLINLNTVDPDSVPLPLCLRPLLPNFFKELLHRFCM